MLEREQLIAWAREEGFDLCGLTPARSLAEHEARFRAWLGAGHHASLGYLERNIEKRFDASLLVEGARTVVVCAVATKNPVSEGYHPSCRTKIASYACMRDYHTTLREMLQRLLVRIRTAYPATTGRAFVDSAPLAEKSLAVEAGLGWIGRQSLLVTPQYGTFVHLGELVLTTEADHYDTPFSGNRCGSCRACIDHCPTGAICAKERLIDTRRCIACHTIEQQPATKIDLDGWIFGCDSCQHHCPYNRQAPLCDKAAFTPLFDPRDCTAEQWLAMSEAEFEAQYGTTPMLRSGLRRIQQSIQQED